MTSPVSLATPMWITNSVNRRPDVRGWADVSPEGEVVAADGAGDWAEFDTGSGPMVAAAGTNGRGAVLRESRGAFCQSAIRASRS